MSHASRSILTRSPCVSVGLRIASPFPMPLSGIPVRDFSSVSSVPLRLIQSLTPLESALTRRAAASPLESALTKNEPASLLEYALTKYTGGGIHHLRVAAPRPHAVVTPLESALTKTAPASPLESALTKYPGGGGGLQRFLCETLRSLRLSGILNLLFVSPPHTLCRPVLCSTFNGRLSTSHSTMLKSYRRLYDQP